MGFGANFFLHVNCLFLIMRSCVSFLVDDPRSMDHADTSSRCDVLCGIYAQAAGLCPRLFVTRNINTMREGTGTAQQKTKRIFRLQARNSGDHVRYLLLGYKAVYKFTDVSKGRNLSIFKV